MGDFLTSDTIMTCPHEGIVEAIPGNSRATIDGAPILRAGDAFIIAGCTLNVAGAPHPCVTIKWSGASRSSTVGAAVLTSDSVGMCQAADQAVQGQVEIVLNQTSVSGT